MWKCLFCVTFLVATVSCRFSGDSCVVEDQLGTCTDISQCQSVQSEIRSAGNPMPYHLASKLQRITCGFNSYGPMVCCLDYKQSTTEHMKLPNRKKPMPDDDKIIFWDNDDKEPFTSRPNSVGSGNDNRAGTKRNDGPMSVEDHPNLSKLSTDCGSMDSFRISGGNRTSLYEMPWMVLLAYRKNGEIEFNCGGTLINEWYVLTAAHCVDFLGERTTLESVVLGEWDIRTDPDCERMEGTQTCAPGKKNVGIASTIPHPGYSPQTLTDDIALIRLAEPADFKLDNMGAICLPFTRELQTEELVGQKGVVAGWGITELGIKSTVLLSVALPIISNKDCQDAFRGSPKVHDTQMCAGGEPGKDSCGGDSGGPIMYHGVVASGGIRYVQRGVVSYGSSRCGVGGFPGVYTKVAYYMDWILNNIS